MAVFKDRNGKQWAVDFDAFILDDVLANCGLDLADLSGEAWHKIATNSTAVGKVMATVCADQLQSEKITDRTFARLVTGSAINHARAALEAAALDFFPESDWYEIQSQLPTLAEMEKIGPAMKIVDSLPDSLKASVMEAIKEQANSTLPKFAGGESAIGQDDIQQKSATDLPESVEQAQEE